ncbi:MAG TPA: hypothetical protein PKZ41_00995 [Candidatus Omnitrophota bacterium]|nr:hypothetical protein [Candidatus Omnitrophota bacterium]
MIKLDISMILFVYLFFSVILMLAGWFFFNFGTRTKMFVPDERYIWHCPICSNNYIDSRNDEFSECPRCGSCNQKEPMDMGTQKNKQ